MKFMYVCSDGNKKLKFLHLSQNSIIKICNRAHNCIANGTLSLDYAYLLFSSPESKYKSSLLNLDLDQMPKFPYAYAIYMEFYIHKFTIVKCT